MSLNLDNTSLVPYGEDILACIDNHSDIFLPLAKNWEGTIDTLTIQAPTDLEGVVCEQAKKLVAILGPGAVGKGTIQNALGWDRIINTTTRERRPQETEGKDYYFTQEQDFDTQKGNEEFAVTTFREGRGFYGISWTELDSKMQTSQSSGHLVIEENADILNQLHQILSQKGYSNDIHGIYLVPPRPRFTHLLARYIKRCHAQGQNPLDIVALESTLGQRQIKELNTAIHIANNTGNNGLKMDFVENHTVPQTLDHIHQLAQ